MKNAWAGGYEAPNQHVQTVLPVHTPQAADMPRAGLDEIIKLVKSYDWLDWFSLACFVVGAITILCFLIGRSTYFPLVKRLFKEWRDLLRGK
jgi:hypothetical protein